MIDGKKIKATKEEIYEDMSTKSMCSNLADAIWYLSQCNRV